MDISLNNQIAMKLQEMSDLLEQQGANPFRIKAYRQAAITLTDLGQDVADILQQGRRVVRGREFECQSHYRT